jgi:hypothetical protein
MTVTVTVTVGKSPHLSRGTRVTSSTWSVALPQAKNACMRTMPEKNQSYDTTYNFFASLPPSLCHALSELRVEDKSMDLASESVLFRRLTDR